ncbi:DUF4974 domain-containing protein [Salegentibacter sp. BLCTC]|uniref:FecR family protein n=1 Tax=Salegentibacter sp. BLCTC TaxID=2697368 RepID=UPI00187B5016|nr:FecR domain-containing protein [Salegentibacter sp. BLCTC]MBE7641533.1 DUF4974 domain-containing protein [Salegentibacter sp. BLCTC]
MNQKNYIKSLLFKFSRNRCSEEEIEQIISYFQKNPKEQVLPEAKEVLKHIVLEKNERRKSKDKLYAEIEDRIYHQKTYSLPQRPKKQQVWFTSIAAIFITVLSGSLFLYLTKPKEVNQVPIAEDSIILEHEDGTLTGLSQKGNFQLTKPNGKVIGGQRGDLLVYNKHESASAKVEYNTLKTPNGKRFKVQLSDGSLVFMNAGSSLKYPVNFSRNDKREVFLIGEAFFKITKDLNRPFKVSAQNLEIGVLGTEFNVSAYPEDTTAAVVLVEGAVQLHTKQNKAEPSILKPGQLASTTKHIGDLKISEVDPSIYTSWMEGRMVFRNMSFEDILKKMERHFGVSIINKNKAIAKEKFNASFGQESILNILEYFKKTYGLEYTQECDKKFIINPKTNKMN